MTNQKNRTGFLLGALIGFALGAASALLLAPKTGKELRGDIADTYRKTSDKSRYLARRVGDKTVELPENIKKTIENLKMKVSTAIEGFREAESAADRPASVKLDSPSESDLDIKEK